MGGFKKFLLRGNLVDLAVAFVIGAAFSGLVTALVADFITPLLALLGGKPSLIGETFTVHHAVFLWGHFLTQVISFVIIAAVVYFFVVLPVGKLLDRYKPAPDEPTPTRDCPHCLSSVPQAASVCAYCTRDLEPSAGATV